MLHSRAIWKHFFGVGDKNENDDIIPQETRPVTFWRKFSRMFGYLWATWSGERRDNLVIKIQYMFNHSHVLQWIIWYSSGETQTQFICSGGVHCHHVINCESRCMWMPAVCRRRMTRLHPTASRILLVLQGRGFEIAQLRLGPGRTSLRDPQSTNGCQRTQLWNALNLYYGQQTVKIHEIPNRKL